MDIQKRHLIDNIADLISKTFNFTTPLDMKNVVTLLKGQLEYESFEDPTISGKIEKRPSDTYEFKITINSAESEKRQNFTIAHELGHLFIHMGYLINKEQWEKSTEYTDSPMYRQGYSEEEYEANEFAGAFLMPEEIFKSLAEKFTLPTVASRFNVSQDAALTRGRWLGIYEW